MIYKPFLSPCMLHVYSGPLPAGQTGHNTAAEGINRRLGKVCAYAVGWAYESTERGETESPFNSLAKTCIDSVSEVLSCNLKCFHFPLNAQMHLQNLVYKVLFHLTVHAFAVGPMMLKVQNPTNFVLSSCT